MSARVDRMRVAHVVCSDAFAGVERYVASLGRLMAERGADVTVIGGAQPEMLASLGPDVRFRPAATVRSAMQELRGIGSQDIVNTHMSDADLAGLLTASRTRPSRLVSTRHFSAPRGSSAPVRAAFRAMDGRIATQISISEFVAREIGGESVVIHTGVADRPARGDRGETVLVAQRLEAEKHTDLALDAWRRSTARESGWRMQIAGRGSQEPMLRGRVIELGIADSVDFLGYRDDVDDLMASAGMLFAPTPREALGLSVVEAMAHGLPVVASGAGGHLETVGHASGAALFEPGDAADAAARIDRLVADPAERSAYGERLQKVQRRDFGLDRWVDQTLDAYRAAVRR
jgi:glycosyltransferase involved in cell wall biosynthesis